MTTLEFHDLSPYSGDLTTVDDAWLARVAELDPGEYRVGIDDDRIDDERLPLVERGRDGRWWAGRYIGLLSLGGRRVVVLPRLGIEVVEAWLDQAFGLAAPPASARHKDSATFIVRLLARLWCRSVDAATRHGLPLLRLPQGHEGLYVRGRLEVRRTLELLGQGRPQIASVTHDRSLQHPITRAIISADRVLAQRLGEDGAWRTERVRQVLPHLRGAVGSRPRLPSLYELAQVRYTPITLPFKRAAMLSHRIASRLGFSATDEANEAEGILIDVAELWELFVLSCARQAVPPGMRVQHGTTSRRRDFLLRSQSGNAGMGKLKPDVLVLNGDSVAVVIDAKYKRLVDTRERPMGVDQADLYQLGAYATRYKPAVLSALVYPHMASTLDAISGAERLGPWWSDEQTLTFERLPTTTSECQKALTELLTRPKHAEDA